MDGKRIKTIILEPPVTRTSPNTGTQRKERYLARHLPTEPVDYLEASILADLETAISAFKKKARVCLQEGNVRSGQTLA